MRRIKLPSPMQTNLFAYLPEVKRQTKPAPFRFQDMLKKKRGSECIIFKTVDLSTGYGKFRAEDKIWRAHRYAYFLAHGMVPPLLRHTCNNTMCCNAAHLKPGTNQQNSEDMVAAGRQGKALKPEQVQLIVMMHCQRGQAVTKLAERYGVGVPTISNIITGKTWSKVTGIQYQPAKPHQRKRKAA
jgi:hypothetical protein